MASTDKSAVGKLTGSRYSRGIREPPLLAPTVRPVVCMSTNNRVDNDMMTGDYEHNITHFNVITPIATYVNVERNMINNNEISTKWQSENIKWQDVMPEITVEPPVSVLNPLATEFKIDNKETVVKQVAGDIDSEYSCDKSSSQRKLRGKIEDVTVEFL